MASYSYGSESTTKISSSDKAKSWQGRWLLSAINAQAKSKIPAYSIISNFKFTVYAREVTNGTFNSDVDIFFANSSESSLKSLKSDDDCVYSSYSGWTLDGVASAVQSGNANAGQIVYSSADRICIFLEKTTSLASKDTWAAYYTVSCDYTEPTFVISLTAGTGGTVSGAGTYNVGSSATIKATPNTGYRFVKWSDGNTNATRTITKTTSDISANVTELSYSAVFEKITYTATFKNYDGTVLQTVTVEHGSTPSYTGSTPTRASTAEYSYAFSGWSPAVGAVTANAEYTAQFTATKRTYTVTWKNHDGTVLETDTSVAYGTTPTYNGSTPTKASTAQYNYSFSGWSPSVSSVTGNAEYVAQFTATTRKYTVRWFNEDGTLLETDTTEYGKMPTYDGGTPTKAATAEFTYTFKGWHIEVATVTGAIDYYARYTETTNKYTVLWKNDDGKVLETDTTEYGVIPTYDGATPTKASTAQFTYTFFGWDTTVEEVTRDVVYTAVYTETVNKYTLEASAAEGGTVTGGGTYEYGSSVTLTAKASSGYKFVRWSDGITTASRTVTVTGNASYTALFEKACPIFVNTAQVQAVYVNEITKTITYIIEGEIPAVNVIRDTVDGWHFEVSNTVPDNSHEVTAIYINEDRIM